MAENTCFKNSGYAKKYHFMRLKSHSVYALDSQRTVNYWQNRYKNLRAKSLLLGLELTLS